MALTTVNLKSTFRLDVDTKRFDFLDTTDYAGQSISLTDVTGVIKVVSPTGSVHYNNTNHASPDIDPDVALTNTAISVPLLSSGLPVPGTYTITYTVRVAATTTDAAYDVVHTNTFQYNYASPSISQAFTIDCLKPELLSVDNTSYTVNTVAPTTITRDHKIFYPASLELASVDGTGASLSTNTVYTKLHQAKLTTTLVYDFTGYSVQDEVTNTENQDVNCDEDLCDVYCCISAQYNRYKDQVGVNATRAQLELQKWTQMLGIAEQIEIAYRCNKAGDTSSLITDLLKLGNCEPGCGCTGDEPTQVTGLGGSSGGTVVVATGDSTVVVASNTAGDTTTYTITIDPDFVTKVNDSYNTTVAAGTNTTVSVATDGSGNKTYTINAVQPSIPESVSLVGRIIFNVGAIPTVSIVKQTIAGSTKFQTASFQSLPVFATWSVENNEFILEDFLKVAGEFIPMAMVSTQKVLSGGLTVEVPSQLRVSAAITEYDTTGNGSLSMKLVDSEGTPFTGAVLNKIFKQSGEIRLSIIINE